MLPRICSAAFYPRNIMSLWWLYRFYKGTHAYLSLRDLNLLSGYCRQTGPYSDGKKDIQEEIDTDRMHGVLCNALHGRSIYAKEASQTNELYWQLAFYHDELEVAMWLTQGEAKDYRYIVASIMHKHIFSCFLL